ncbi:MAG TPA: EAL domain-containing protein, partial [Burkholderiales bacterium]|nr:EAL domain-containing protein [Burkholderiales bacterium]
ICDSVEREGKFLVCRGNIPPLSPLYVLKATPESLIEASRNAARKLAGRLSYQNPEIHPLVFGCTGRNHYLQEKFTEEVGQIADAFENGIVGALTLGQIANGSDGCLSLFNRSIVLGMPGIDRESRSQKAVNLVSMQHALTMLVSQSTDLVRILRHFLPQAIRLVNCRSAHVWLRNELEGEDLIHRLSYPAREQERLSDYPRLQERISAPIQHMEIVTENTAIFHVFPIGKTGVIVLRRNSPMPDELVLALAPAIHRLEESCLFAMHHAHCERTKEQVMQDASLLLKELEHARNQEADLVESERHLNFILESIPHFVCWKDAEMIYRGCNGNFARLEGFESPAEVIGKTEAEMPWRIESGAIPEEGAVLGEEKMLMHVDGRTLWVSMSSLPMRDGEGNVSGILSFFEEIGERKRIEEELRISSSVFESTDEGILVLGSENRIVKANDAILKMTGFQEEALLGTELGKLMPEIRENAERIRYSLEKTGSWHGEIEGKRRDGVPFSALLNICAVKNEEGIITHRVAIFGDITDRKETERRLEDLAHFDPLTNLPNRTLLAEDLRKAMLHSERKGSIFALAFLDLDDFKPVNDQHGHETGDKLLIEVANRLKRALRGEDTIARLGGDEFVMLLTGIKDMSDVETTLARVLSDLSSPYQIDGYVMRITVSIGVTVYPFDNADTDTLLRHADQAMYLAKQSGRNRFQWFDSKLDMALRAKQEKLSKLRFALERSELKLHYQPKINLRTGAVIGLEALIRWMHPDDGLIGPMAFLPLAEQTGLILDIGKWILHEALGQMAEWIEGGIDFPVSVNVSAAHLKHPSFVDTLEETLALHPDVPPSRLELEILETAFIDDFDRVRETMINCQKMGVSFSLDDFGTGYSSLAYLKHLPVDTVKVDKTFIHDMKENTEDISIIEGVISLARIFSRMVIAEGVETSEHGMLLVRLGCDFGQGYGIAKPMPPEEVPKWLAQFNTPSAMNANQGALTS